MAKTINNAVFYSIGEIAPRAFGFFLLPIYTSYLSPTDYGIISYIRTVVMFLFVFGCLALNSYTLRFFFLKSEEENRQMIGTVYLTIFVVNIFLLLCSFLFLPTIIDRFHIQVPWDPYFKLALIVNFLDSFSILPFVVYRVKEDALKYVILGVSKTFLMILMTIYMLVFRKQGLEGYYHAQLYIYLPFTFIYLNIIRKHASFCLKWQILGEGLRYALPLVPGSISYLLLSLSDRIILERNVPLSEIGIYNMAVTLSYTLNILIQGGYRTLEPEVYKRYGRENYFDSLDKIKGLFFSIVCIGGFAICIFAREFFEIMTANEYHTGYIYVPLLVSGVVLTSQNKLYDTVLSGDRMTKVSGIITVIGAGVSMTLNLFFIPVWGTFVAACSALVSMLVMNIAMFYKMRYPNKTIVKELCILTATVIIPYITYELLPGVTVINFILEITIVMLFSLLILKTYRINGEIMKILLHHNS